MNTECMFNKELISAYLDNELSGEERCAVETHLDTCPECHELAESFKTNDLLASKYVQHTLPPSYWNSYEDKLNAKIRMQTKLHTHWKYLLAAAAAVLIAVTVYLFWPHAPVELPDTNGTVTAIITAQPVDQCQDILNKSESVLIAIANIDENNPEELAIIKQALAESNLADKIRELKSKTHDGKILHSLKKLEAVFILLQNENSSAETKLLKELIIERGLIEQLKSQQTNTHEVRL